MKVSELLEYATAHGLIGIVALIELLVLDKQVVKFTDDVAKLDYYFQASVSRGDEGACGGVYGQEEQACDDR